MPKTQPSRGNRGGNFIEGFGKAVTGRSRARPVQNAVLSKQPQGRRAVTSPVASLGATRVVNPGTSPTRAGPVASVGSFGTGYTELTVAGMALYGLDDSGAGIPPELVGHLWQGFVTRNGRTMWAPVGPDADEVLTGLVMEAVAYAEENPVRATAVGFGSAATAVAASGAAVATGLGFNRGIRRSAGYARDYVFGHRDFTTRQLSAAGLSTNSSNTRRGGGGGSAMINLTGRSGDPRYDRFTLPFADFM